MKNVNNGMRNVNAAAAAAKSDFGSHVERRKGSTSTAEMQNLLRAKLQNIIFVVS